MSGKLAIIAVFLQISGKILSSCLQPPAPLRFLNYKSLTGHDLRPVSPKKKIIGVIFYKNSQKGASPHTPKMLYCDK